MNKTCVALLMTLSAAISCLADPDEYLLKFPDGDAAWTVKLTAGKSPGGTPASPVSAIEVTQVGGVRRIVMTAPDGKTAERWSFNQPHLTLALDTPSGAPAFLSDEPFPAGGAAATGFDASCFAWLKGKAHKGTATFAGQKCLHYWGVATGQRTERISGEIKKIPVSVPCEAWVDPETFLPLALFTGRTLASFTFHEAPAPPLTPPPTVQRALDHYNAASEPLK